MLSNLTGHHDFGHEYLPALGKATECTAYKLASHTPAPHRFVWHHLEPEVCGGATDTVNCVQVCDNCHYTIHALLYALKQSGGDTAVWRRGRTWAAPTGLRGYAQRGWELCVASGTTAHIPNEGGALWSAT